MTIPIVMNKSILDNCIDASLKLINIMKKNLNQDKHVESIFIKLMDKGSNPLASTKLNYS